MKIYIDEYENPGIITSRKIIRVDLPIKINKSLKHDIKFSASRNESIVEYTIKNKIIQLLFKYGMNMDMNMKKERSYELYIK